MDEQRRLHYLQALGVDAWVPGPRFPGRARPPRAAVTPVVEPAVSRAPEPDAPPKAAAAAVARDAAVTPAPAPAVDGDDWDRLCAEVAGCTKCGLHATRTQAVFGNGARDARWMVVGEAPGGEEDRQGAPFVGRAGQLLNAMLRGIGLPRESVFVANILKCRPPHNRDPKPEEVASCLPYLQRQVALVRPTLILAVGRIAAQNLLATDLPLGRLRSRVHRFGDLNTPLVVTYHPAYLLRSPGEKRKAWEDLKFARRVFGGSA